jgi:hypothetical protein
VRYPSLLSCDTVINTPSAFGVVATRGRVASRQERTATRFTAWALFIFICGTQLVMESAWSASAVDDCLARRECKFLVWRSAHPPAQMAFAALASQWREFSADDRVEIARRLKTHLEAMRKDPQLYAHSKEFGAGISTSSPMFRLIVRNIARANRYAFLTGYRSNDQLYIDSTAANPPYE